MSTFDPQVGDPCNWALWTDVEPCTVVARTATTCSVRINKTELAKAPVMVPGGFAAVVVTQAEWTILPELDGPLQVFSRRKSGQWKLKGTAVNERGNVLSPGHRKVYDYGF